MHLLRADRHHRSYAVLATLTIALAVGANLLVFTIVNALWLRPRPVADPERVVVITNLPVFGDSPIDLVSETTLETARRLPAFESVAGQVSTGAPWGDFQARLSIDRVGHPVETAAVTSQYFSVLGVTLQGRDFLAEDDGPGARPVAIISDRLWASAFSRAPGVLGSTVTTSHVPVQIVGIAPRGFGGPRLGEQTDLWLPRSLVPRVSGLAVLPPEDQDGVTRALMPMLGLARLRPGVTAADAERALAPNTRLIVRPLKDVFGPPNLPTIIIREQTVVGMLWVTAAIVLVAGCTTLMAIVLVHYERRRQELAVRLALGASRAHLAQQLALELIARGGTGLMVALAVTWAGTRLIPALPLPGGIDLGRLDLTIDWRVLTLGLVATVVVLGVSAIVPLLRFSRTDLVLNLVSPRATSGPTSIRLRSTMLSLHVAATIVVLVAAGLFVRTLQFGFGAGPGFDADRTVFLEVQPSLAEFYDPADGPQQPNENARKSVAYARLLGELSVLPGVEIVASGHAPLQLDASGWVTTTDVSAAGVTHQVAVAFSNEGSAYLAAIGAGIIAGRSLTPRDAAGGVRSAVISKSFGAKLWPRSSSVGQRFKAGRNEYQVVGLVSDVVCGSFRAGPCGRIFTAEAADTNPRRNWMAVVVRTRGDAAAVVGPARRLASDIYPRAARLDVRTGRDLVVRDLGQQRLGVWFFSGFGAIVLTLGLCGVFGLVAYQAETRRREFGLRMALGATSARLLRRMVWSGLSPVLAGTVAGIVAAFIFAKGLERALAGVSGLDPITYAGASMIMTGGALVGSLIAAWGVSRLSPMEAISRD